MKEVFSLKFSLNLSTRLMPVFLATGEAKIGKIEIQFSLNKNQDLISKIARDKSPEGVN
jgi:hypothetical protein